MAVNIPFCEEKSWNECFLSMWEAFVNPFHFVRQVPVPARKSLFVYQKLIVPNTNSGPKLFSFDDKKIILINLLVHFQDENTGTCLTKWKGFTKASHILRKHLFQLFSSQKGIFTAIFLFPGSYLISKSKFLGEKLTTKFSSKKHASQNGNFYPSVIFHH